MLERGTLNLLCGGPSAGKTTIVYQAILAHERGEQFFVHPLRFPEGPIFVINTDRSLPVNDEFFRRVGIKNTPSISFVDNTRLHELTRPKVNENASLVALREALTPIIIEHRPSTVILDLYGDFISGDSAKLKNLAFDGRENVRWAKKLNVALLGLAYPYKQKSSNMAARVQDRIAGALTLQASAHWKFNIIDASESKTCWFIDAIPPPFGGPPQTYTALRANDEDGIGRFQPCEAPPSHTIKDIMAQNGVGERAAYAYRDEDLEAWMIRTGKKKPS